MTEPKGTYKTEAEEALDMLGKGYDKNEPAAACRGVAQWGDRVDGA
jgi:hypothetical protein